MNLLLDTHTVLQFFAGDERIPTAALVALTDAHNSRVLSMASLWEIAIKHGIGKLAIRAPLEDFVQSLQDFSIGVLPIELPHVMRVASLPHHHRDPFDRLIVAQSLVENLTLVSSDSALDGYGIVRLWNTP